MAAIERLHQRENNASQAGVERRLSAVAKRNKRDRHLESRSGGVSRRRRRYHGGGGVNRVAAAYHRGRKGGICGNQQSSATVLPAGKKTSSGLEAAGISKAGSNK